MRASGGGASLLLTCPLGVWRSLRLNTTGASFLHAVASWCFQVPLILQPGLTPSGSCPPFRPLSCWAGPSCASPSCFTPFPGMLSAARPFRPFEPQLRCLSLRGPPQSCGSYGPSQALSGSSSYLFLVPTSCQTSHLLGLLPKYCLIGHLPQGKPDTSMWKLTPKIW